MGTPVTLYTTAGLPLGARAVIPLYRPNTTNDALGNPVANVIAFGSESSGGSQLGGSNTYIVEDITLDLKGTSINRMGTYGEDADKALNRASPTLRMTLQMATAGTATPCPGDYTLLALGMQVSSTGPAPVPIANTRWFISSNGVAMNQNQANKFTVSFELDRQNSSPNLKEF